MPFCERPNRRIHYTVTGEGPGLLLVPGLGSGSRLFGTLPRRFARAGFTCAAVDPVGLPPSSPLTGGYSFAEAAADLLAIGAELPGPLALVGTSLGGKVALQAAAEAPEGSVRALVLLASSALRTPRSLAVYRWFRVLAEHLDPEHLGAALAPFLFGATFHEKHPEVVADIVRATRPDRQGMAFMAAQTHALPEYDGAELAPRVRAPVLCIAGAEDTLTLPADVAATARLFADGRYVCVPDAGHSLFLESPRVFDEVVRFAGR